MSRTDHAREVRLSLTDPLRLCERLGWLDKKHSRQARGVLICCPSHGERNPSCSVRVAPDGTIQLKCHACDFAGDALTMVAFAYGLNLRDDFAEVLAVGAELAGNLGLADEIRGREVTEEERRQRPRIAPAAPREVPEADYPPADELEALWRSCADPSTDAQVVKMLHGRAIDFVAVADLRLARVITPSTVLPKWAKYRGKTWRETGHRLLLPAYDHHGIMRSVRAWRVIDGDTPKRLPPGGCKASGLVQANKSALLTLRGEYCPKALMVMEGEPDFLVVATEAGRFKEAAVIGIGSGSWTEEFAKRVSPRTEVFVGTHGDKSGDAYADHVIATLGEKCPVLRWRVAG